MDQYGKIGKPDIMTLPLPDDIMVVSGTYSPSGRVLLTYQRPGDTGDYYRLATLNDDGTDFLDIYEGEIQKKPGANGIRFMCFSDNRRVLLGDYVLECEPDMDHCTGSRLVPVVYPPMAEDSSPYAMRWSEIVVAPDNAHMAWTALSGTSGSVNLLARMVRGEDGYRLEDVKEIAGDSILIPDTDHPGYSRLGVVRGGEIKQFVRGGKGISLAGMGADTKIADSVVQALDSEEVVQITHTPCYDETTILSPDERLGIVMSTRFSPKTNCAILALVPRPYMRLSLMEAILPIYMFSVASVRQQGDGNIGPALIELDRSMGEDGYLGVNLSDPEGRWVYHSPMSWHPDSRSAMWVERERGGGRGRLRIVRLPEYVPSEPVPPGPVPEEIPYARPVDSIRPVSLDTMGQIRIKGAHSGEFYVDTADESEKKYIYERYSDDGKIFYKGEESFGRVEGGCIYRADLTVSGDKQGRMELQICFAQENMWSPVTLDYSQDENGLCRTRGYAEYQGKRLSV